MYLVLTVAVTAISAAAVIVRGIDDAEPLAIALWRTSLVGLLLLPGVRAITWKDAGWIALSGGFLAFHFTAWFASLQTIDVLRSTTLVCLTPLWAGMLEGIFLRRPPGGAFWGGVVVATAGTLIFTGGGQGALVGDALALLGGIAAGAYLVIGRNVRARVGIATYASLVCIFAALWLVPVVLATHTPVFGFSARTMWLLGALALGPQLLGHNGFNYALRYLPAATVSLVVLLEPVGATVLAALLLSEYPTPVAVVGGTVTLAGVGVAATRRARAVAGAPPSRHP